MHERLSLLMTDCPCCACRWQLLLFRRLYPCPWSHWSSPARASRPARRGGLLEFRRRCGVIVAGTRSMARSGRRHGDSSSSPATTARVKEAARVINSVAPNPGQIPVELETRECCATGGPLADPPPERPPTRMRRRPATAGTTYGTHRRHDTDHRANRTAAVPQDWFDEPSR